MLDAMGAALAGSQGFLTTHFTALLRQTAQMGREPPVRRLKIIANYLRRFHQDGVLGGEALRAVWGVFCEEFPAGNKAYKEVHDGFISALKL